MEYSLERKRRDMVSYVKGTDTGEIRVHVCVWGLGVYCTSSKREENEAGIRSVEDGGD